MFTPTWRRWNDSDTLAVMATEAYATLIRLLHKGAQLCAPRCPHHLAFLSPRHAAHRLHTRAPLPCPTVIFACERVRAVRGHRYQPSSRTARVRRVPPLAAVWRPSPCAHLPSIMCICPPPSSLALLPFPFLLWLSAGNQMLLPAVLFLDALPEQ